MRALRTGSLIACLALAGGSAAAAEPTVGAARCGTDQVSGTIHVTSLTIRLCKDYAVERNFTIRATGSVTIDRPIEVAPGASLTIIARGRIVNDAPIEPLPAATQAAHAAAAEACREPAILEKSEVFGLDINAPVTAPAGDTGSDGIGCTGTTIELTALVGKIELNAVVRAGTGGPGRGNAEVTTGTPGPCHEAAASTKFVRGGAGGRGGSVFLDTVPSFLGGGVTGDAGLVRAGDGGTGGAAGGVGSPVRAPSGGEGESGGNIRAWAGGGGQGGTARWDTPESTEFFGRAGPGGSPGGVNVSAGDGGAPNCNGGETSIEIFPGGEPGYGSIPAPPPSPSSVAIGGGDAYSQAPADGPGGRGGDVTIRGGVRPVGVGNPSLDAFVRRLTIVRAGNGGPGANRCPTPGDRGGDGGSGGLLERGLSVVHVSDAPASTILDSFNAARGGNGNPPGHSGAAGMGRLAENIARHSFLTSTDGDPCPRTSYRPAHGSLSDSGTGALGLAITTRGAEDAVKVVLPTTAQVTGFQPTPGSGFTLADCFVAGNEVECTHGDAKPKHPVMATINFTGTVSASCGCVYYELSDNNGRTFSAPLKFGGPPASSSSPAPAFTCVGPVNEDMFDNWNGGTVANGGTPKTYNTAGQHYCVVSINDYHWNNGLGSHPGTIAVRTANGTLGPYRAVGSTGSPSQAYPNGVPDANWTATPSHPVVIDGAFTCVDSDPATWSQNPASGGEGFCKVYVETAQPAG